VKLIENAISKKVHMYTCGAFANCGSRVFPLPAGDKIFEGDITQVTCKRCLKDYKKDGNNG
jgi:hypothetical protein